MTSMQDGIIQRGFREGDLPRVIEFKRNSMAASFPGKKFDQAVFKKRLLWCARKRPDWIQVLEKDGEVIGYAWFGWSKGYMGRYGFLHQLFIDEKYRQKGLAQRLLKHAEAYMLSQGIRRMQLRVTKTNAPALKLYEKMQYRKTRIIMEKKL